MGGPASDPELKHFLAGYARPSLVPYGLLRELLATNIELRQRAGERPEPEGI